MVHSHFNLGLSDDHTALLALGTHARSQAFVDVRITRRLKAVYTYLPLPVEFTPKDTNVTGSGVDHAKSWECGIQQQVHVKHWVYGRTACLTKSDWKWCICALHPCHGIGGGWGG